MEFGVRWSGLEPLVPHQLDLQPSSLNPGEISPIKYEHSQVPSGLLLRIKGNCIQQVLTRCSACFVCRIHQGRKAAESRAPCWCL